MDNNDPLPSIKNARRKGFNSASGVTSKFRSCSFVGGICSHGFVELGSRSGMVFHFRSAAQYTAAVSNPNVAPQTWLFR